MGRWARRCGGCRWNPKVGTRVWGCPGRDGRPTCSGERWLGTLRGKAGGGCGDGMHLVLGMWSIWLWGVPCFGDAAESTWGHLVQGTWKSALGCRGFVQCPGTPFQRTLWVGAWWCPSKNLLSGDTLVTSEGTRCYLSMDHQLETNQCPSRGHSGVYPWATNWGHIDVHLGDVAVSIQGPTGGKPASIQGIKTCLPKNPPSGDSVVSIQETH